MVKAATGKPKARADILKLQIRQLIENLLRRETACKKIQHIADTNSQAENAWAPAALLWINCDSLINARHLDYLLQVSLTLPGPAV